MDYLRSLQTKNRLMKNHYVMTRYNVIIYRGTLDECRKFCEDRDKAWSDFGSPLPPQLRVFYGTATEPTLTIPEQSEG